MSERLSQVVDTLQEGKRLVIVQDEDAQTYSVALREQEAGCDEAARPVIEWDDVDGYMPPHDYPDDLPESSDLTTALEFVKDYRGRAIHGRGIDYIVRRPCQEFASRCRSNPALCQKPTSTDSSTLRGSP